MVHTSDGYIVSLVGGCGVGGWMCGCASVCGGLLSVYLSGGLKDNGGEPKNCLGLVFHFKLCNFSTMN